MDSIDMNSGNSNSFDQYRPNVEEEFLPEADRSLAALREEAALLAEKGYSAENALGFMRKAADSVGLSTHPDSFLEKEYAKALQAVSAPLIHANIVKGGQRFKARRVKEVVPGFIKENALHMLNAEQGTGKSCFCLALFRALVSDEQTGTFLDLKIDSSKNWRLFLIGVDMPKDIWFEPLVNYGLLTNVCEASDGEREGDMHPGVTIACQDVPLSLSPEHIEWYALMAAESKARGERPLFVFDSYRSLTAPVVTCSEIDAKFADPLDTLYKAMGDAGATTIVLHHTAKSKSGSTQSSGVGTGRLGSIPDVVIEMQAESRDSKRVVVTSSKRITASSLIVQQHYSEGHWECHGDGRDWHRKQDMIKEQAAHTGRRHDVLVKALEEWEINKRGFTMKQMAEWQKVSKQAISLQMGLLHQKGLLIKRGQVVTTGKPADVFYPWQAREELDQLEHSEGLSQPSSTLCQGRQVDKGLSEGQGFDPLSTLSSTNQGEQGVAHVNAPFQKVDEVDKGCIRHPTQIIPCHPIGTAVEHNGGNGWRVIEANLASGMHVIQKGGLTVRDLRMMDLPLHFDMDAEL